MELVVVATLAGFGFVATALLWHLLVHPDVVVALWDRKALSDEDWQKAEEAAVRGLGWALSMVVILAGFLVGLTLSFLTATR